MKPITECKQCGSTSLFWFATNTNRTGVMEGRLRTHEITCEFVLGCNDCSETLRVISADSLAEHMNRERSKP
ncbi:hypothetical protein D3C85_569080 [compost metagenome]